MYRSPNIPPSGPNTCTSVTCHLPTGARWEMWQKQVEAQNKNPGWRSEHLLWAVTPQIYCPNHTGQAWTAPDDFIIRHRQMSLTSCTSYSNLVCRTCCGCSRSFESVFLLKRKEKIISFFTLSYSVEETDFLQVRWALFLAESSMNAGHFVWITAHLLCCVWQRDLSRYKWVKRHLGKAH